MNFDAALMGLLSEAKHLAKKYRSLTGKPLGITGEVAEFEAARLLGLTLSVARQTGYDATETVGGIERKLQIKGRCVLNSKKSQRIGSIDIHKGWDSVLLVLLDHNFDATGMFEAERDRVIAAITEPGSKARNDRGSLGISKFKSIATCRWTKDERA